MSADEREGMAKRLRSAVELPPPPTYNAIEDEVHPGETMDDYMTRKDGEESQWRGQQGGQGATKHDVNESRTPVKHSEYWDCHMGEQ